MQISSRRCVEERLEIYSECLKYKYVRFIRKVGLLKCLFSAKSKTSNELVFVSVEVHIDLRQMNQPDNDVKPWVNPLTSLSSSDVIAAKEMTNTRACMLGPRE